MPSLPVGNHHCDTPSILVLLGLMHSHAGNERVEVCARSLGNDHVEDCSFHVDCPDYSTCC